MSYPNPYDGSSPILGPMLKAYQLFEMMDNITQRKATREQAAADRDYNRARQKQLDALDVERHNLNVQQEDSKRGDSVIGQIAEMGKLGADDIRTVGDLWFSPNRGSFVPSKAGTKTGFKLPSQQQVDDREIAKSTAKTSAEEKARQDARPKVALPAEIASRFGVTEVPQSTVSSYLQMFNATSPQYQFTIQTDADGNTTIVRTDKKTMESTVKPLGPIGKPSKGTAEKTGDDAKKVSPKISEVQKAINKARTADALGALDAAEQWDNARALAKQAAELYPDMVEVGGTEKGEYPYIKFNPKKRGAQGKANSSASAKPPSGAVQSAPVRRKTITQKQYDDYVRTHGKAAADKYMKQYGVSVQ